ncbi:DUF1592 domain-containing protein, partial [Pseudomaricurvus hydrocarbonicus]
MVTKQSHAQRWNWLFSGVMVKKSGLGLASGLLLGLTGCDSSDIANQEPEPVGGPTVMRQLSESQYRATVADIFGTEIPVVARFGKGLRAEGLLAVGSSEAGISAISIEQYDAAARSVATAVVSEAKRSQLVPCTPHSESQFDAECASLFVQQYGPPLFRRPLTDHEVARFVGAARTGQEHLGSFYEGLKYALSGMMLAPDFLLRIEHTEPPQQTEINSSTAETAGVVQLDAFSKATRLSYFLTNSTPDTELLRAAAAGELNTEAGLEQQVDRLLQSPHFEQAVRAFFEDMLQFDLFADLAKDPLIYPAFNSEVVTDSQEQTLRTITDLLITQNADYRDLFTTREAYLTRALGGVYRLPVPTRHGWEKTEFPVESNRAGIQSHISFLALHAHPGRSSPTLRGLAARDIFLCQDVPDPPANVNFSIVQDPSNASMPTARERLQAHRTEPSCAGCHKIMDPLGLTLENFDGL